jgi:hypothetical protein
MIGSSDLQSLGVYIPLFYEVDEMTDSYPTDKAEESRGLEHLPCSVPANVANDATWSLSDFLVIRGCYFCPALSTQVLKGWLALRAYSHLQYDVDEYMTFYVQSWA